MVFKALTLDLTEDINTTFPYTLPSSPESTICVPFSHSCAQPVAARVAAGVSQLFAGPTLKPANQEEKKSRELPCIITSADIDPQFPEQKQLRSFTYQELQIATDNFIERNVMGWGGFSTVYKGRLSSGYLVAVKRIKQDSCRGEEGFRAEVQVGKMVMHRNVAPLIGFCEAKKPIAWLLVYPYMGSGSLQSYLYERTRPHRTMDWETRKRIATGVARGLSYLHNDCFFKIIHRDIKPGNILLDKNLEPRIGDFGLARFMDHKMLIRHSTLTSDHMDGITAEGQREHHSSEYLDNHYESTTFRVFGTYGYMAPESSLQGKYSPKTDVFAFGTMLLELISGCKPWKLYSPVQTKHFYNPSGWVKQSVDTGNLEMMIDSSLMGNYSKTEVERLIKLSLICIWSPSPVKRPDMSEVTSILEGSSTCSSSSLDTRWEAFQQNWVEVIGVRTAFNQEICSSSGTGFAYSASHLHPEELSGPR